MPVNKVTAERDLDLLGSALIENTESPQFHRDVKHIDKSQEHAFVREDAHVVELAPIVLRPGQVDKPCPHCFLDAHVRHLVVSLIGGHDENWSRPVDIVLAQGQAHGAATVLAHLCHQLGKGRVLGEWAGRLLR